MRFPVVALIASAGGIKALVLVLRPLPGDLPAAVFVAMHQDPARVSHLAAILQRDTRLPIGLAGQDTVMRPGCGAGGASPDLLLSTLAVTRGSRAVAVDPHRHGTRRSGRHPGDCPLRGTVRAQDEATSQFFSMPAHACTPTPVLNRRGV